MKIDKINPYNNLKANVVRFYVVPKVPVSKELNYLKKEDYGKVPEYLTKVREEIRRENDMIDTYVQRQMGVTDREHETFDEMPDFERQDLILALKDKWDAVNARYQQITHLIQLDNTGQIRRKEQLETELKTLETDIEYLSQPGVLLVKH
jgi:chromosome segregation ATPase